MRETMFLVGGSHDGEAIEVPAGTPYLIQPRLMTTADAMAKYDREVNDFPQTMPDNRETYLRETISFSDGYVTFMHIKTMTPKQALEHLLKRKAK